MGITQKIYLTDRFISGITLPEKGRDEYYDAKIKGLSLRVTHSGKKTFSCLYRLKGEKRQRRETIGEYPYISLAEARKIVAVYQAKVSCGEKVNTVNENITVGELIELYWAKELKHIKTADEELRRLNKDALPAWGCKGVKDLSTGDIALVLEKIPKRTQAYYRKKGLSEGELMKKGGYAANRFRTRLFAMFEFARAKDLVKTNPVDGTKKAAEYKKTRRLSLIEIRRVWRGIEASDLGPKIKVILKLDLLLGQRGGEICTMFWEDIDWDSKIWGNYMGKVDSNNKIPLTDMALGLIKEGAADADKLSIKKVEKKIKVMQKRRMRMTNKDVRLKKKEYIFKSEKSKSGHVERHSTSQAIGRNNSKFKVVKFTPHDLRRTMRTMLSALGVDRVVREIAIGHSISGVEGVYDRHDFLDELREAFELWERVVKAAINAESEAELEGEKWRQIVKKIKSEHVVNKLSAHLELADQGAEQTGISALATLLEKGLIKI